MSADRTHMLKTWPAAFQAVMDGRKTHEYRRDIEDDETPHMGGEKP